MQTTYLTILIINSKILVKKKKKSFLIIFFPHPVKRMHKCSHKSVWCENEWCMHDHCHTGRRNTNEVCLYVRGVKLHFLSPCHCVVLEMSELIGVAGKCEVCFPPPLLPPPPPPPL